MEEEIHSFISHLWGSGCVSDMVLGIGEWKGANVNKSICADLAFY